MDKKPKRDGKGCRRHPDCLSCELPPEQCRLLWRYPDVPEDHPILAVQDTYEKLLVVDGAYKRDISQLSRLRKKRSYQKDKAQYRHSLGIPRNGFGRREADKWLQKLEGADSIDRLVYIAADHFAKAHPLDKLHPMPSVVALEELLYRRPSIRWPGYNFLGYFRDGEVMLVDGKKAPQPIARLVQYKLRGDDNALTECVNIVLGDPSNPASTGFWALVKAIKKPAP